MLPPEFKILPLSDLLRPSLQNKIDQKTKPLGALGLLESLALQIGLIQNSLSPTLENPCIIVFAADHGIVEAGVSAYPQTVTRQMVDNFLAGGAAINVLSAQQGIRLVVVDAGINADLAGHPQLINAKIAKATANFLTQAAMTSEQCLQALHSGAEIVLQQHQQGCNCIGFGEMAIGNTSAAALLMHKLTGLPLAECVGRGTGLNDAQLQQKLALLQQAAQRQHPPEALAILAHFGGFEIAMMVGAYWQAAALQMTIMVDGFIASAALLVAAQCYPAVLDYCVFCHASAERGHRALLKHFNATPLLNLDLRLGEGTGAAIAYPLLQSAVLFLKQMASFGDAGVDGSH
ncbi:MAG: nicotinate-nucleotide--dimethylbenzimidazole phosphoribosyltransferase [Methylococcaceae bacterium]|jgi:nicotinate-nucleotide--dimethylbenzimidazole phosphoribosyltransferase